MYLSIFNHPHCPSLLSHTHARRTYDRALRTLSPSLHVRIWTRYLIFAERTEGDTLAHVYRRYLRVDPSLTEHFAGLLLDVTAHGAAPRPLEAAKLLLSRARAAARGEHVSQEGKSAYQLFADFLDVVERFPEEVGMDPDDADAAATEQEAAPQGGLIRAADLPKADGKTDGPRPYDEDEDPLSPRKLDIEKIVRQDGLKVYTDQAGRLWTGLAAYWTRRGEFDRAKATFEAGIASVLTIKDFTQIFDAYAEFCEELLSALMKQLDQGADDEEDDEDKDEAELEEMLDVKMKEFEELMDRRPFLVNDVLLRRNQNDVQEWEKRIALWGQDDVKVMSLYDIPFRYSSHSLHRSQRRTPRRSKRSNRKGRRRISTEFLSALPSSMRKVERQASRSPTSIAHGKSLNGAPR
jgi:pre-mRNA-splicing factor SYF1